MNNTILTEYVIDVTEQTFVAEVIERSQTTPVVVDFWAAWCGPCRMLGPVLESLAEEYQGNFILAKVDVDSNPNIARQFQVQGIPAVKAFVDGRVASEFTGVLPEPQVREFINKIVPSEADLLLKQANALAAANQSEQAERDYRAALAQQPDHYGAMIGLGRLLLEQGEVEEALTLLESIPAGAPETDEAQALLASARFSRFADNHTEAELLAALEKEPGDVANRYALANLYAGRQQYEPALEQFLQVVQRNRSHDDDGARKAMLAIFAIVGEQEPLVDAYRRRLANALF